MSPADDIRAQYYEVAAERTAQRLKGEHRRTRASARTVTWVVIALAVVIRTAIYFLVG